MKEKLYCEACPLEHEERVLGNGITEPPYLFLIRCPFDDAYYMHPDDECSHEQEYKMTFV